MGQKSRWALPETVHPEGYRRFVVCVPDERFYIAAFQGLLIELTYSKNWQRDSAHTAAEVSRIWQDVLANATCDELCTTTIEESDYDMSLCEQLRFSNGKLQALCCGEWVDITGQPPQGPLGPDQPGGGSQQPTAGGGCATYEGKLRAGETWLLPTIVNTGDTIAFSAVSGAGTDGTLNWYCNDGQVFFGGACVGQKWLSGSDPAPALSHMALVLKIGSTYYDISAGPITVPASVSSAQAFLQCNDSSLSDNSGDYKFTVTVCNNQLAEWTHTYDFKLSDNGFVAVSGFSTFPGLWVAGTGWTAINAQATGGGVWRRVIEVKKTLTSFDMTGFDVTYAYTKGSTDASGDTARSFITNEFNKTFATVSNTSGETVHSTTEVNPTTVIEIDLVTDRNATSNAGFSGSATLSKIVIHGKGPQPTW